MQLADDEPGLYYDTYEPEALVSIIDTQRQIVEYQKKHNDTKHLFQILIVVDDHAGDPAFSRNNKLLHSLFTRGRHSQISTLVSTQKSASISPLIRVNASELYVFRLRNHQDLETFLNELGGIVGNKQVLMNMYRLATDAPFSFFVLQAHGKGRE